jgi:hypothetical protein
MAEESAENVIEIKPPQPKPNEIQDQTPHCERLLDKMFWITLLPCVNSKYIILRWGVPLIINIILAAGSLCIVYYPTYYATQSEVWTTDIIIVWFTYNYMIYLYKRWNNAKCSEAIDVSKITNGVSFAFYILYLLYWLYFAVIQFNTHNESDILIQLGNTLMSTAWFIFFSTISVLYYFICVKLTQRSNKIHQWFKEIKQKRPSIEDFYLQYNMHYRTIKELGKYWNIIIFVGSLLLTFHIPIDLISIIYKHYYYDIFGLIVKVISLLWYLWCICDLNDNELYLVSILCKHRIYHMTDIEAIEKYIQYRPLGLNFYGIKINKPFIIKVGLLTFNLIIPTFYALLSNQMLS